MCISNDKIDKNKLSNLWGVTEWLGFSTFKLFVRVSSPLTSCHSFLLKVFRNESRTLIRKKENPTQINKLVNINITNQVTDTKFVLTTDHICDTSTTGSPNFQINVYPIGAEGYNIENKISRKSGRNYIDLNASWRCLPGKYFF